MSEAGRTASYAFCGATLASNVPLPELLPHGSEDPDLRFRLLPAAAHAGAEPSWFHHVPNADGSRWLSHARTSTGYLLRFANLADFTVSEDGREIACRPAPGTPDETTRHLLVDQVLPLTLGHQGTMVLHAGAVAEGGLAAAFVGEAGRGKSTLAACFCRVGWSLLSDDALPLREEKGRFLAEASYPGLRLWPDALRVFFGAGSGGRPVAHYSAKRRVDAGSMTLGMCNRRVPLRAVYLLEPDEGPGAGDGIRIAPVPSHEALLAYLKYLFRLDTTDQGRLRAEFERLSRLTEQVPVRRLWFRRDLACLPALVTSIRRDLGSLEPLTQGERRIPASRREPSVPVANLPAAIGGR